MVAYGYELIFIIMSGVEDKDKKIADLRALLTQAKAKIEEYKAQVVQKVLVDLVRRKRSKRTGSTFKKVLKFAYRDTCS